MRNEVVLKCMGHVKMHGFHGNPLYESREWGLAYRFKTFLEVYLSKIINIAFDKIGFLSLRVDYFQSNC